MVDPKTGIENRFESIIRDHNLWTKENRLLIAVSGGVDSMVLLRLLLNVNHWYFEVAHVNYGLRGADSDKDEFLVKSFCEQHNIRFHLMKVSESDWSEKGSIQMVAREKRYEWFHRLLGDQKLDYVVTAHHADDNLETSLYNFTKGTGIAGLRGMLEKVGTLIRPLLSFQKEELLSYATSQNLKWREDITNQKSDYARNKIRNSIVPVLQTINPNLIHTFQSTRERLIGLEQLLDEKVHLLRKEHLKEDSFGTTFQLSWYRGDHSSQLLLSTVLKDFGVSMEMAKQIFKAIHAGHSGKLFFTPSYQLNLDRDRIILQSRDLEVANFDVLADRPGTYELGLGRVIEISRRSEVFIENDASKALLDAEMIHFPIVFRHWREGDVFQPLGMKGQKKLSDFFVDQKLSRAEKSEVLVACSGGIICWVVGMRIDHRFRVKEKTSDAIELQFRSNN